MPHIKLVIFDLDGTLVDAYTAITESFNYTMTRCGYPRQDARYIRRAVGWGDRNLLAPFVKPRQLAGALLTYRRHHAQALRKNSRLIPGARRLLAYLKSKGYTLAVASNRPTKFSRIIIRHLKLDRYFSCVLCADTLPHGKPHPEILRRIMGRFSLGPSQTLYVGDMAIDAQAARRAKVKTVIVTGGSSKRAEIMKEKPWRIIVKLEHLRRFL
jgi:phosphoglycolate phosphatase